jgi:23S rRNA pseudouridine2605 synthase
MRLQRFLSQAGIASRRKAEQLIDEGHITVNGKLVLEQGLKIDPHKDRVAVDGKRVYAQDLVWLVLHKPPGTICSTEDPEGRQTVMDLVHIPNARLYPVGRLDYATSGVLLITNDGELANALLHPKNEIPRTYHVKVSGNVPVKSLEQLRDGVVVDGQMLKADCSLVASTGRHTWIEMTIRQGINHQIHRMLEAVEHAVLKLIRVEFAGIRADNLRPATYRTLTQREINELRSSCNLVGQTKRQEAPKLSRREGRGAAQRQSTRKAARKAPSKASPKKTAASKRPLSKKTASQKTASQKVATKKRATKKTSAEMPPSKKAATKRPLSKKPATKKETATKKKATGRKRPVAKKPPQNRRS